ncbi:unnamed protein product [Ascophyllum nodosum]
MSEAQVYVPEPEAAWARATVLHAAGGTVYEVRIDGIDDYDEEGQSNRGAGEVRTVDAAGPEFGLNSKGGSDGSLPLQNLGMEEDGVEDMTRLDFLHEPAILFNLRRRFFRALPYTYTGEIVIAVNPYRWLDLYGEERGRRYADMVRGDRSGLPPHVYSTSAVAFAGLSKDGQNQSILVSGESGAGKTETVKILMGHLAVASNPGERNGGVSGEGHEEGGCGSREKGGVIRKIIESNPLLESFGNAKTTRNDNSSRFGKFTQLQFNDEFRMAGSGCTTYLLEKSRVVGHEPGERAYHVFYQILAAPEGVKKTIGLEGKYPEEFRYLTADGNEADSVIEGRTDAQRFEMTAAALGLIGVGEHETVALFRALAGVLFLGEVTFSKRGGDDDKSEVVDRAALLSPSELLGLGGSDGTNGTGGDGAALESSLCYRTIRARNDVLRADSSPAQAADARDAMAKAIYGGVFEWLVGRINRSTAANPSQQSGKRSQAGDGGTVSLLDIFGFESFRVNRFEQLCINYANEKLQQKFTLDVFKTVQVEYEEEGIPWNHVDFSDNAEVLGLVESRMGIIAVLNEECVRPRGSDVSFVSKLSTLHADHSAFARAKLAGAFEFAVKHYAGEVLYNAEGFLDKNRDSVGEACRDLLARSTVPLVAELFVAGEDSADAGERGGTGKSGRKAAANSGGGGRKGSAKGSMASNTLATKFKDNLTTLMDTIGRTAVQYVRCIKPNSAKLPGSMENSKVAEQLRCAGVIEAIRISRAAYPNRMARKEFNKRFALLMGKDGRAVRGVTGSNGGRKLSALGSEAELALSNLLLGKLLPRESEDAPVRYEMGKTKVFFCAGALEHVEALRLKERSCRATVLQAAGRMWPKKMRYHALRRGALRGQTEWRRIAERRRFLTDRGRVVLAQACWRRVQAGKVVLGMRRNRAATCVQSYWRMVVIRRRFRSMQDASVVVQTFVRGALARRSYAVMVVEHREAAKLENQILALQRKLDEERKARLEIEKAHKQLALRAEAASKASTAAAYATPPPVRSRGRKSVELPPASSAEEAGWMPMVTGGEGGGGVGDLIGDANAAGWGFEGGSKASPSGAYASAGTTMGDFMREAMGFFSPMSQAQHDRLMAEEDERREASLDIMGESSQIIAALKAEVDKLRKDNDGLKTANESLRRERQQEKQKALSTYEASGMSYHALNQTVKALSASKKKITAEMRRVQTAAGEDRAAMLEIVQSKTDELVRREQEGRTTRLLYESEVTKCKNTQHKMEEMIRLVAETSTPIDDREKNEMLLNITAMYKESVMEDPDVVMAVDNMMSGTSTGGLFKATSALSTARAWFSGRRRSSLDVFI